MQVAGIICEYNPLHLGHKKQIDFLKAQGYAVVCLMSGNFVQRGHPAIFDKLCRARAAVECGADLVLELPLVSALSSAEGFAAGGVAVLSQLCDTLCFGAENADRDTLLTIADALLSPQFSNALRPHLDAGLSFPAARTKALAELGLQAELLDTPNNILAIEYCKAIRSQGSALEILPLHREGSYHAEHPDPENPSATALRNLLIQKEAWQDYVPEAAISHFRNAAIHQLSYGEKAILYRLRTMTDGEFEALPYGSEGLWRKLMHASRECQSLEEIIAATKSKRYTRTRIDRMILCAFLGITEEMLSMPIPYIRVLAFNDRGREILKTAREALDIANAGESREGDYAALETRCGRLYGLFSEERPEAPTTEHTRRVLYVN